MIVPGDLGEAVIAVICEEILGNFHELVFRVSVLMETGESQEYDRAGWDWIIVGVVGVGLSSPASGIIDELTEGSGHNF